MDKNWNFTTPLLGFAIYYLIFSLADILGTKLGIGSFYVFFLASLLGGLFLVFMLYHFAFKNNGLNDKIDFYGQKQNQDLIIGILTGIIIGGIGAFSIIMKGNGIFSFFSVEFLIENILPTSIFSRILFILIFTLFIPFIEEYYFRGFMFPSLYREFGIVIALIGTSICSSVFLSGSISFIYLFLAGIVYGILAERTKGVAASTIGHVVGNLIIVVAMVIRGGS